MTKALIVTILNEEGSIGAFLDSVANQTQIPDEIVIVDGGSKDHTLRIIKAHPLYNKGKIALYKKAGNRSVGRNYAISKAKADINAITDAGCVLEKNWFKNIVSPFIDKKVDVVAGYYKAKTSNNFQKNLVPYVLVMPDRLNPNNFLPATRSMAIRTNAWRANGRFNESLSNNEDYDFAVKLRRNGLKIKFAKNAIVYWIPRNSLRQAFVMFYRFAKGDMEANIIRPKVVAQILRYLIFGVLLIVGQYLILASLLLLYVLWSISKNYKYVKNVSAFVYLPLLQFTADLAVISGTVFVLINRFFSLISVIILILLMLSGINMPYIGQNAYNLITYSLIAHNYNQFGLIQTKLAPLVTVSKEFPIHPEYFIHHPPLLSIIIALFFKLLGEDFWVGRLIPVVFTILSVGIIYLLEKELSNKKQALYAMSAAILIPATTIFGKLIGQEPLVLFFVLMSLLLSIKYLKTRKNIYFVFAAIAIMFGVLSDWPALIFAALLFPLYFKHGKIKNWIQLFSGLILVFLGCLLWIDSIRIGFWDLQNAIGSRLFTALSPIPYWPVLWIGTTLLRLLIYFNPILVIISATCFVGIVKKIKTINERGLVILILGLFTILHLAIYTEASFTHPYLLIYAVPFVALTCSSYLTSLDSEKSHLKFFLIFSFSIFYLIAIFKIKEAQELSNVWRYNLAEAIRPRLQIYETIIYNTNYVVDPDIWRFPLLINPRIQDKNDSANFLSKYNYYVYSCSPGCYIYGGQIKNLKDRYQYIVFKENSAEAYLFYLKKKQSNIVSKNNMKTYFVKTPKNNDGFITRYYRKVRDILKTPQI
ncbi:MAG TPA: glycosyltransferase [Patescibacteria group bacterium]|nr:glycosyltransferase [Patescibacteria group bacterium]